jgi:hypothetical protein
LVKQPSKARKKMTSPVGSVVSTFIKNYFRTWQSMCQV